MYEYACIRAYFYMRKHVIRKSYPSSYSRTQITVNKVGTVVVHLLHKSESAYSSESSQKVRLYQRPILEAAMWTKKLVGTELEPSVE